MKRVVAVLATLDTKTAEAEFLVDRIEAAGCEPLLVDLGVVGVPGTTAQVTREEVVERGGSTLDALLANPTREAAAPFVTRGASAILGDRLASGALHGVVGVGGTQGTSTCSAIMRTLPYGFPKVMVSTVASGDTSPFVGIKDVTMMFSVSDLLGLNPVTRRILANAAAATCAMAAVEVPVAPARDRQVIGLTNLGVLTAGAMRAVELLEAEGFEVIVFHAVGSGGLAMEQMMRDGIITAVLDYGLGEITDELFAGLRAAGPSRLTVALELGLPQVVCPGGLEHVGLFVDPPNTIPERWRGRPHVFHSPVILAPRLSADEMRRVAGEIAARLTGATPVTFLLPRGGTSRYSVPGGPLHDPEGDAAFAEALRSGLPSNVTLLESAAAAEDEEFVALAVRSLLSAIAEKKNS